MVKCVRTTCLFSKLQEDVVSRKHHEQCSDREKLLFSNTHNTCCNCCRGGVWEAVTAEAHRGLSLTLIEAVSNFEHIAYTG